MYKSGQYDIHGKGIREDIYLSKGEFVSEKTVKRRCINNYLPPPISLSLKAICGLSKVGGCCGGCKMFRRSGIFKDQGRLPRL